MKIQELFKNGLDRQLPDLIKAPLGPQLNLGPGDRKLVYQADTPGAMTLGVGGGALSDYPGWWAPDPLPFDDGSIAAIHCYQFIEHFDWKEIYLMLRDWERVLMVGGVAYIATPHAVSSMSYQALDHKVHFNEEVWDWLFDNSYYCPSPYESEEGMPWRLSVHTCFIMGVVLRNLNIFTQLVKR